VLLLLVLLLLVPPLLLCGCVLGPQKGRLPHFGWPPWPSQTSSQADCPGTVVVLTDALRRSNRQLRHPINDAIALEKPSASQSWQSKSERRPTQTGYPRAQKGLLIVQKALHFV